MARGVRLILEITRIPYGNAVLFTSPRGPNRKSPLHDGMHHAGIVGATILKRYER